ncbi:hypothetical protein J40TS1_34280 [Paenibacillus montaniterrae]|uniref:Uncharacterized protein n=1 Tax=Paenibacillus montaniterrae TaxID=429341 RepID=A0A919YV14_9BACL|nr:hypothetical protein J40TS1_34280 [Paenibacillus montaniterrae]
MIEINHEKGMIRFDNGEEMFIVPDKLDIGVEEYFDSRMPQWVKTLLDQLEQAHKENEELKARCSSYEDVISVQESWIENKQKGFSISHVKAIDAEKLETDLMAWKRTYEEGGLMNHSYAINGVLNRLNSGDYEFTPEALKQVKPP